MSLTPARFDLTGQRFGRLTVVEEAERYVSPTTGDKKRQWACRCTCGNLIVVFASHLKGGHSRSCGCFRDEVRITIHYKHGHAPKHKARSGEYGSWVAMRARCGQIGHNTGKGYKDYESRGIKVCKRWLKFETFLADMGPMPGCGFSIERLNNNRGYSPSNCIWIPRRDQNNNKIVSVRLTFKGETRILKAWAPILGIKYSTLWWRIRAGWSVEKAFTTPVHG